MSKSRETNESASEEKSHKEIEKDLKKGDMKSISAFMKNVTDTNNVKRQTFIKSWNANKNRNGSSVPVFVKYLYEKKQVKEKCE